MCQLNDQWIETIDGEAHMVKAVEGSDCKGCAYGYRLVSFVPREDGDCEEMVNEHECGARCPLSNCNLIIKDLGILNADGLLPCPFCGEYPKLAVQKSEWSGEKTAFIYHEHYPEIRWATEQECIDAWNRRA